VCLLKRLVQLKEKRLDFRIEPLSRFVFVIPSRGCRAIAIGNLSPDFLDLLLERMLGCLEIVLQVGLESFHRFLVPRPEPVSQESDHKADGTTHNRGDKFFVHVGRVYH
jgi:hypothetical protein